MPMFGFSILLLVSGGYIRTYHVCKVQSRCPRSADAAHGMEPWEWQPLASCPIFLLCCDGFAPLHAPKLHFHPWGKWNSHLSMRQGKTARLFVWIMEERKQQRGNLHGDEWHLESFFQGFTLGSYHWFLLGWWRRDGYAIMSMWPMPADARYYAGVDTKTWLHQRVLNRLGWRVERWGLGFLVTFVLDSVQKFITAAPCSFPFWARISLVNTEP
jgi:hypothetical protein